ncbi:MAG: hypothetical protein WAU68_12285 [Vitreimonas sp.]
MTPLARSWVPLRESLGDEALRQSIEAFDGEFPLASYGDADFPDSVPAEVAAIYHRLQTHVEVGSVMDKVRRRGADEHEIEIIYRRAALAKHDWAIEDAARRRSRVGDRLRVCAAAVETSPELGGFWLEVGTMSFSPLPVEPGDLQDLPAWGPGQLMPFSALLDVAATFAGQADGLDEASPDSRTVQRAIAQQRFVLPEIFDLLVPYFSRAPNLEAETLASEVLGRHIAHGTMTRLRKNERRRYARD